MAKKQLSTYLNNPNLKAARVSVEFTPEQVSEYARCANDPVYFIEKYCKIISLDDGLVLMKLYPYQKRMIEAVHHNRNVISMCGRQQGKSTVFAAYFAWYCTFHECKRVAILANKLSIAKEIFSRVQLIIEYLPTWLQQGVTEWNKTSFCLENKTECFCAATSASSVRGKSLNVLYIDEAAHIPNNLWDEFDTSVIPTLAASKESKLILVSTPKGMNHFYRFWNEAQSGVNGFAYVRSDWWETPGRDAAWLEGMARQLGGSDSPKFLQEIMCSFIGSSHTLILGSKLSSIPVQRPISETRNLRIYENPIPTAQYVACVDVARGGGNDYSVITVIDISCTPYRIAAIYRDNTVSTLVFPDAVMKLATIYNNAFALIETNDLGQQVADTLFFDLEYENVYMSKKDVIAEGGKSFEPGIRTTKKTKSVGCDTLKTMIENDQIIINDSVLLDEASNFVRVGSSFKAEEGKTDDIMMTLVIFAHLTTQPVFRDLFDYDLRRQMIENQLKDMDEHMLPVGFHSSDYDTLGDGWVNFG